MKRCMPLVLTIAVVLVAPAMSSAQTWVPFDEAYWGAGAGQGGGYGVVTESETSPFTYGGVELIGGPTSLADITHLSFAFKANVSGNSGGSPRLVLYFADHTTASLRPLELSTEWATIDGMTANPWEQQGAGCPTYNVSWAQVTACHAGKTIAAIYVVNDSGWMYSPSVQITLDAVNVNGIAFGPTKDTCKKGGFAALGFRNQGECVASFVSQIP